MAEFKDEQRDAWLVGGKQIQKGGLKQRRIQKRRVIVTRTGAVAWMARELLHGNVLGHLEGELQLGWRRSEKLAPVLLGRKLIKREIAADDRKSFGVFAQAFVVKTLLRKPAARHVAIARVDLPQPAFVFPGTGSDENVLRRERGQPRGEALAVELGGLVKERWCL